MFTISGLLSSYVTPPNSTTEGGRAARISSFWQAQKSSNLRVRSFIPRNLWISLRAFMDHLLLDIIKAELSSAPMGQTISAALKRKSSSSCFSVAVFGARILEIPARAAEYSMGANKQTLRRKVRAAYKGGVTWRSVSDLSEQQALINALHLALPVKSRHRMEGLNFSDCIDAGLWTVAFGHQGEPLLIAVTPYDGEWALLKCFVCLGETQQHSDARYLINQTVVERLSGLGVRYLADTASASELPVGLWHFQRMTGFITARILLRRRTNAKTAN